MKQILILTGFIALIVLASCGGDNIKRNPGRAYAPDMYYSRAFETYGYNNVENEYERLRDSGISYSAMPVGGTIARGDVPTYPFPNTEEGYAQSSQFTNPFAAEPSTPQQVVEGERLYLIHCGICHGTNLDGNGPLFRGGDGPYPAAPRNLLDEHSRGLSDGTYYHVIQYGRGVMGSYASQLKPKERWWVIQYIRERQAGGATTAPATNGANRVDTAANGAAGANGQTNTQTNGAATTNAAAQ